MRSESAFGLCSAVQLDSVSKMSTLSVRAPGLQTTTMMDTRSLRVRGVTTIDGVRRNLFGCTDREENRRFVERELARQIELDSQRWGFDFINEKPLPGTQRFIWQLVPASSVPPALRRSPVTITKAKSNKPSEETQLSSPEKGKTQRIITEFMKPNKRRSSSGKKSPSAHKHECGHAGHGGHGAHIRPPKVARLIQTHLKRPS